jgi:DNA-binding LacI/PurR family transcriptional regulator
LKYGLPIDESIVCICDNCEDAEQITPELLQRVDRPDAFFAINDHTAIGILRMVKRSGLRVPEDVSIFGFSDGFRSLASDPQLTSVNQRGQEVGREAVDILVSEVEGILPTEKANKRVVKTEMVLRGTTKIISEE